MGSSLRSGPEVEEVEGTKLEGIDGGDGDVTVGAIAGVSGSGMPGNNISLRVSFAVSATFRMCMWSFSF